MNLESVIQVFQVLTYLIAPVSLSFIALNYWRKSGVSVQGSLSRWERGGYDDVFFGELLLENLKDRSLNILNIYIRLGNAYYLELGDYNDSPVCLGPYELKKITLKPVYAYLINMKRVNLNELIRSSDLEIILSTTTGQYKVKKQMKISMAVFESLSSNFMTVVKPINDDYKIETILDAKQQDPEQASPCPKYYIALSKVAHWLLSIKKSIKMVFKK